jgi:hypothetical protein
MRESPEGSIGGMVMTQCSGLLHFLGGQRSLVVGVAHGSVNAHVAVKMRRLERCCSVLTFDVYFEESLTEGSKLNLGAEVRGSNHHHKQTRGLRASHFCEAEYHNVESCGNSLFNYI